MLKFTIFLSFYRKLITVFPSKIENREFARAARAARATTLVERIIYRDGHERQRQRDARLHLAPEQHREEKKGNFSRESSNKLIVQRKEPTQTKAKAKAKIIVSDTLAQEFLLQE